MTKALTPDDMQDARKLILSIGLGGKIVKEIPGTKGIIYVVHMGAHTYPHHIAFKTIMIKESHIEEKQLNNFVREASKWFKLKGYSLIITPFYITVIDNIPFICMPYCEKDLKSYLEEKAYLDHIEMMVFAAQILKALIFAEERGIVAHQDLKPANVLLEDLSIKFPGFPPPDVHKSLRYRIRLADFGLSDAYKEIGEPQGSLPYMGPEQYGNYNSGFNPDVFALGVMMVEMLSGLHPCGKKTRSVWRDWNRRKWEQWSVSGDRIIKIDDNEVSGDLTALIKEMMHPDATERISKVSAFNRLMEILSIANEAAADHLNFYFEYYDSMSDDCEEGRWGALLELSKLAGHLSISIKELLKDIQEYETGVNNPRQAVLFCNLCQVASKLLGKRKDEGDNDTTIRLAKNIINTAIKWRAWIKVEHMYPERTFRGETIIEKPPIKNIEIFSQLISTGVRQLEKVVGVNSVEEFINTRDKYVQAAYYYTKASDMRVSAPGQAIELLNQCIDLIPEESLFYFIKALWIEGYISIAEIRNTLDSDERGMLEKSMYESLEKALQLEPDYEEAKAFYERKRRAKTDTI